jgi:quercetin dioxygenase-like cupin family protein
MTLDDLSIVHHFGDNEYIKETHIPAGTELEQHKHKHSHLSVLVKGKASVTVDGVTSTYDGYHTMLIGAHKSHKVTALTDCTWLCVWGTTEKDVSKIDDGLIE